MPLTCSPSTLDTSITSFEELVQVLDPEYAPSSCGRPPFPALNCAIDVFTSIHPCNFYTFILPHIIEWASQPPDNFPKQGLEFGEEEISSCGFYTSTSCKLDNNIARFLLANMFLLNTPKTPSDTGKLSLYRLFQSQTHHSGGNVGVGRVCCLLAYFYSNITTEVTTIRDIVFERRKWKLTQSEIESKYLESPTVLTNVNLFTESMEISAAHGFVDFANRDLHIHRIIPSATQEEVLFSCAPEAFIAIGLCSRMEDNEVILLHNVQHYSLYTGYLDTFKYAGLRTPPKIITIISIDAVSSRHFEKKSITRDVSKALLAFLDLDEDVVTGHWGCGVFGGDKTLKFLQQWVAASLAGVKWLEYSVFGDEDQRVKFKDFMTAISIKKWTVADVSTILFDGYTTSVRKKHRYETFVMKQLSDEPTSCIFS